ncbi:putative sugar O-methyltransferase [Thalassobaculum sp.]|uniref:putative sugar O-methyltransferase n=1 Tax=Thalassobaculum sp. TaxID=2022740 RepID=UPI0032EF1246
MPDVPSDHHRRSIVQAPAQWAGYDAAMIATMDHDPDAAIRAAQRACLLEPNSRRMWNNFLLLLKTNGRARELHTRTPRRRKPLPPRAHHPVDLDAAEARYGWLLSEMQMRSWEGWTPSRVEDSKYRFPLTPERLARFRSSEVSSGTQTAPDRPSNFPPLDFNRFYPPYRDDERARFTQSAWGQYAGLITRLFRQSAPGIDWYDAAVVDDDRFGARVLELPGVGTITSKSLHSAYYACRIMSLIPKNGVVLEIGGGFGSVASRLMAIRPDVTYVLTDLPVNMVLTYTYLRSLYGDAVTGLWEDGDTLSAGHRAAVVPPWRLRTLPLKVDLALNTMSFQHMDERNHLFYGNAMRTLGTRRLYHVNRNVYIDDPDIDTMVVPAQQYAFMKDFEIVETHDFDGKWIEVIAKARD